MVTKSGGLRWGWTEETAIQYSMLSNLEMIAIHKQNIQKNVLAIEYNITLN